MARPPNSKKRDTCAALRAAAIRLFSRKGFAGTSTRELCCAARITKPVLYHYFTAKEDLFQKLIAQAVEDYRQSLARAEKSGGSSEQRLVAVVWNDFEKTRRDPELLRLLYRVVFAAEPVVHAEDVVAAAEEELWALTRIARQGIRSGEFRGHAGEIGMSVLGVSNIYTLQYMVTGRGRLTRALARRCVQIALQGCAPPARAAGSSNSNRGRAKKS